jgi:hypothetical protein
VHADAGSNDTTGIAADAHAVVAAATATRSAARRIATGRDGRRLARRSHARADRVMA